MSRAGARETRRRRRRLFLLVWLVLLAASHLWRAARPDPPLPDGFDAVEVAEVDGDELRDARARIAYRDLPAVRPDAPVLLCLHGSPGGLGDFTDLEVALEGRYRIVAPDLPGFGLSEFAVPDYSIRAHAHYVVQLLDELELERVHVVGFSMGGGVAMHLTELAPERVASVTMAAALGVVELELFGQQALNHLVHGAQLFGLRGLTWLTPHFGLLDRFPLNVNYARNFFDTDQRDLRGLLESVEVPFQVVHGTEDFLVPFAAARETWRLVPQSELVEIDGSHFVLWQQTAEVAAALADFVDRVESGEARTRATAAPIRLARAAEPWDPTEAPPFEGPALLVLFLLVVVAALVSEDLTCIGVGLLIAQGRVSFPTGTAACFLGNWLGDFLLYLAGRWLGRPAVRRAPLKWFVKPEALDAATYWFMRSGAAVVFISRLIPGTRLPAYIGAGLLNTSMLRYAIYFAVACLLWTPAVVGFAAWAGAEANNAFAIFEHGTLPAFVVLGGMILFTMRVGLPAMTWRGRRLLVGGLRRRLRWEFWSTWIFYPPVVAYWLGLAARYRSLTLMTAANPGIPTGGFIGESKTLILDRLASAGDVIGAHAALPLALDDDERVERALAFAREHGFPVVHKPDVGQRGLGVRIVESEGELAQLAHEQVEDALVQEWIPGEELGVFYIRMPDEEQGRLFSITEKVSPVVVGDGEHDLEHLILTDERAVCLARRYFEANAVRLGWVPDAGEEVRLVEIGTHCRGSIFRDGARFGTPELVAAVDRVSKQFEGGFFFGRYDLRYTSEEELRAGRFRVIEVNGVTSEAAHIYDPKYGVFHAWRTIMEQWRLSYVVGAQNRERGIEPDRPWSVIRAMASFRLGRHRVRRNPREEPSSKAETTPPPASAADRTPS